MIDELFPGPFAEPPSEEPQNDNIAKAENALDYGASAWGEGDIALANLQVGASQAEALISIAKSLQLIATYMGMMGMEDA